MLTRLTADKFINDKAEIIRILETLRLQTITFVLGSSKFSTHFLRFYLQMVLYVEIKLRKTDGYIIIINFCSIAF